MNSLKRYFTSRTNLILLLLIVLAILPRFIFLDKVPTSINADELHYAIDAKSFFLTGKDVLGQVTPFDVLLFNSPKSEPIQADLQYFLEIPVFGLLGFSLANLIFPNAVVGVLTVLLIYLVSLRLFNKNVALLAGLIAAINPWLIFLSRTTYEAGLATLFFLCVFYILLVTKDWKILFGIPFALLAFYSYIGTKLIFLPFMFLSILYVYLYINNKKYVKQYLLVFLFSVVISLLFIFRIFNTSQSRTDELITPNSPAIIQQVNNIRKATIQNPFTNLVTNKYTVYSEILVKNTFNIFSPTYLFANADTFFLGGGYGLFYYVDAISAVLGLMWLFVSQRKLFLFFLSFMFISILPQILHDSSGNGNFTPHVALLIPFLILFIALGINGIIAQFKNKKYRRLVIVLIVLIYFISFLTFCNFYFFQFPLKEGTFEIENRILSEYISLSENEKRPIIVYSVNPKLAFREFLFYSNSYNKNTVNIVNESLRGNKFVFNDISFISCSRDLLPASQPALVIDDANCDRQRGQHFVSIAQLGDSGKRYNIYGDNVCSKFNLPSYISNLKLSDFGMENLSQQKFCETFVVSYH